MSKKKRKLFEKVKQNILKCGIKEYVRRCDEIAMKDYEYNN